MPLDCIVINLTRFGDLLQSQPLLHDLHAQGFRTGLVCLENFASTLPLLTGYEASFTLRGASLLGTLDRDWKQACTRLLDFTKPLREEARSAYIINLTATIAARLLARLLSENPARVWGFGIDEEGFGTSQGSWATFLSGTTLCRQNAVFNMGDMFRFLVAPLQQKAVSQKESGLQHPTQAAEDTVNGLLHDLPPHTGLVAFQLGASEERRQWPSAAFAELGDLLYTRAKLLPVLTGTKAELPLAGEYTKMARSPVLNLIGRTSLPELQALLTRVRLLVSNDTGTLHLAAGMKTPCVGIFLATAQPWDTGPYLENCLCIEPDLPCHPCAFQTVCSEHYRCRESISPGPVADQILHFIRTGTWLRPENNPHMRLWQTVFDDQNMFDLQSLSDHAHAARTLYIRHQRLFWRQFLGYLDGTPYQPDGQKDLPPCPQAFLTRVLPALEQTSRILPLLVEQLPVIAANPAAGRLFLRNCDRIQTLLTNTPDLVSLGYFWRELRMEKGQNLNEFATALKAFSMHLTEFIRNIRSGTNYATK